METKAAALIYIAFPQHYKAALCLPFSLQLHIKLNALEIFPNNSQISFLISIRHIFPSADALRFPPFVPGFIVLH